MTDDQFRELCNTFGFAPSRALREMLDKVAEMERESCAKVCDDLQRSYWNSTGDEDEPNAYDCAAAIRARSNT